MTYENVKRQKIRWWMIPLILLALSIPVCGILAAVSIPAFVKYLNEAKVAEGPIVVQSIADQISLGFAATCEMPPSLPPLASVSKCCGGEQCFLDPDAVRVWEEAGMYIPPSPTYLVYETEFRANGAYLVRGVADFGCDGEPNHTHEMIMIPDFVNCTMTTQPGITRHRFQ
jgi:hypothetical protein